MVRVRYLLNRHVHRDYNRLDPVTELVAFARSQGISEAFVGQMTAVSLQKARAITLRAETFTVAAVLTAGLSNATTPGLSAPVTPGRTYTEIQKPFSPPWPHAPPGSA